MNFGLGLYPDIESPDFYEQITRKKEFLDNKLDTETDGFSCLLKYQKFLRNFMSILTNYNGLLLNHYTGLGKTLSAISIAEGLKSRYNTIIISKNDILLNNFKQEISGKCTNYITIDNLNAINDPDVDREEKLKIYKEINKEINKYYSFYKYTDIKKETRLDNKLVIIDEVHNITGNSFYINILECLRNSKNVKLVVLSATPTFDKCFEIFYIINLLNVVDNKEILPDKISDMTKNGLIKNTKLNVKNTDFVTKTESLYELTEKGEETIKMSTRGKVSFLLPDQQHFAKKKFNGKNVLENNINSFIVYKSMMSSFQKNIYSSKLKDPGVLYKNASDASTMVYPDKSTGENGFVRFIKDQNQKTRDFLKVENIKKYSSKLYNLVKLIDETNGIVFIFSNYVNNGGTNLIKHVLRENGYSNYSARNDKPKYYFFNESTSVSVKNKILTVLNSPVNKDGSKLKIIIGSPFISEGITFKNIRQIHILEPYWNFSRIDQVIGRGIRFRSHEDLPQKDRVVDIYLHVAIGDSVENSIDVYKYKICQFKDTNNKKVEYILKKNSIDCFLNKSRNMLKDVLDYTRECQYKKCEYICPFEITDETEQDDSFELSIHGMEEFDFIKKNIKNIFKETNIVDVDYIIKYIKEAEDSLYSSKTVNKKNIYYVLDKIIEDSDVFLNNKNIECYILKINKYYIANPKDNPVSESFYNKLFVGN